jgi:hypothetical protein
VNYYRRGSAGDTGAPGMKLRWDVEGKNHLATSLVGILHVPIYGCRLVAMVLEIPLMHALLRYGAVRRTLHFNNPSMVRDNALPFPSTI